MSVEQLEEIAPRWIKAWNERDLDTLISFYSEDCVFTSPINKFLGLSDTGTINGADSVRALMAKCFVDFADLKFELIEVLVGVDSYIVSYKSTEGLPASTVITLNAEGKIQSSTVFVSKRYMSA